MSQDLEETAKRFFGKDIFLDAGPLLLFLLGSYNLNSLRRSEFEEADFFLLLEFLKRYKRIIVTPQVLAEVSNLANRDLDKKFFSEFIKKNVNVIRSFDEKYVTKNSFIGNTETIKLGLTDGSIIECCKNLGGLLLTKDLPLELICKSKNLPVIHFDKLRALVWGY